jgi:hypothetical protein
VRRRGGSDLTKDIKIQKQFLCENYRRGGSDNGILYSWEFLPPSSYPGFDKAILLGNYN